MIIVNNRNSEKIESLYGTETLDAIQSSREFIEKNTKKQKSVEGYFNTVIHLNPVNVHFDFIHDSNSFYSNHDFYKLIYALSEPVIIFIEESGYILEKGEGLLISPSIAHQSKATSKRGSIQFFIKKDWLLKKQAEFEAYDSDNYLSRLCQNGSFSFFSGGGNDDFDSIMQRLTEIHRSVYRNASLSNNLHFEYLFSLSLVSLTARRHKTGLDINSLWEEDSNASRIIEYIMDNYATTNIEDIAEHFGYSKTQIHRIVKTNTGSTVSSLILSQKMHRAKVLLLNSNLSIDAIALELGYENPDCFSKMFKRNRGLTPYQYRRNHPHVGTKNSLKIEHQK